MTDKITAHNFAEILQSKNSDSIAVDIRNSHELESGKIHNTTNIPMDTLKEHIDNLKGYTHVYLVCGSGRRCEISAKELEKHHIQPIILEGGISSWKEKNLPLE